MKYLKGNLTIGILLFQMLGFLGVIIGLFAHTMVWVRIAIDSSNEVRILGYEGIGIAGIMILVLFGSLLYLNSVYTIVPAVLFVPYILEQSIGLGLLRYIPLETTKLQVGLYLYLPVSGVLLIIGAFAPLLSVLKKEFLSNNVKP